MATRSLAVLAALAALVPCAALADVDPKFAALRDAAEPVGGLGQFLDNFIGECATTGGVDGECKQNAAAFRQKMHGKKLYMIVTEDRAGMLSAGDFDMRKGEFTIQVTPFFSAGGYALTQGAPKRTDANGNPMLPYITLKGAKEDWDAMRFQRLFSSRELRLQVVFTPQEVWTLPKKGGGKIYGVRAKIEGLLVTVGRTGEQAALWVSR